MNKLSPRPSPSGLRTWQQIGQRAAGRSLSPVARRKRIIRALGVMVTLAMAVAVGLLGAWGYKLYRHDPQHLRAADSDARLQRVDFQSDGVLTEDWARAQLGVKNGDLLPQYDLFALQKHLLATAQVREAFVERVLPDTLRIRVSERRPLLRLAVDDGAGGYKPYLVARDGTVYEGNLYPDSLLHSLQWLAGAKLHRLPNGGLTPIPGLEPVGNLLTQAKAGVPELAAQWQVVDLSGYDPRPQAPLSLIKVRSSNLGELVFLAGDFHRQLDRLALIAQDLHDKQITPRGVDLSLDEQAVVQLADTPAPMKPAHAAATHPAPHPSHAAPATNFTQAFVRNSFSP
ncbi:MAG: FtsQ-type POTRA domain-containing protein [Opitutales bacterium]|jgi:cell division septal protein FtsQ